MENIAQVITIGVGVLTIGGLLYGIFSRLGKIYKKQEELDEFKKDTYRNRIIRFENDLRMNPNRRYPEHMYTAVFNDYDKYKKLLGNTYVDQVIIDIRARYKQCHGKEYMHEKVI